jgi:hypothetical protein
MDEFLIILGGAPVTRDITELFVVDGYADLAGNAVQEAIETIGRLREMKERYGVLNGRPPRGKDHFSALWTERESSKRYKHH